MRLLWTGLTVAGLTAATGCATRPAGKPVLTADAYVDIKAACHVDKGAFHPGMNSNLPWVEFAFSDGDKAAEGARPPSVDCMTAALASYRYGYYTLPVDAQAWQPWRDGQRTEPQPSAPEF